METACSVGGETSCDEVCVVLKGVGGVLHEIAQRRGVEPKKLNIDPCGLDIIQGRKWLEACVERPHVMRGVWWLRVWEGRITRLRGGGYVPKSGYRGA
jgi:hypothetical protein